MEIMNGPLPVDFCAFWVKLNKDLHVWENLWIYIKTSMSQHCSYKENEFEKNDLKI